MDTSPDHFDPTDEALLTAYALGECDADEAATAERFLQADPMARRVVDDVRQTALLLADGLRSEPDVGLTAIHVAGIERRLATDAEFDAPHPEPIPLRRNWGLWGSVAASTLIVATVMATVLPQVFRAGQASPPGNGSGANGTTSDPAGSAGAGNPAGITSSTVPGTFNARPPSGGQDGALSGDWPILKTSAGGLPWPSVISRQTGFYEPAFVVPSDFPIAIVPPPPDNGGAAGRASINAIRSALDRSQFPHPQSVRADELVNALQYGDPSPGSLAPVSAVVESAVCPWNSGHLLVRVAVRTIGRPATESGPREADGPAIPAIVPLVRDLRLVVEVNPAAAAGYRVIGYENGPRSWGEWAGRDDHEVLPPGTAFTALLEVVPAGQPLPESSKPAEARKYLKPQPMIVTTSELLTVSVDYRQGPDSSPTRLELPVSVEAAAIELASPDFRAAAGAAALGMSLRHSERAGDPLLEAAIKLLADVTATAPADDRQAMLDLARKVKSLGK